MTGFPVSKPWKEEHLDVTDLYAYLTTIIAAYILMMHTGTRYGSVNTANLMASLCYSFMAGAVCSRVLRNWVLTSVAPQTRRRNRRQGVCPKYGLSALV